MKCVILAAGEGKRMRPLTARRPKVMLPLANRPMMEHLLAAIRDAGVNEFVIVVGYGEREIREHFRDGGRFGVSITYAMQRRQRGTADAILAAHHLVTGDFLMVNGDILVRNSDIRAILGMEPPAMGTYHTDHPEDYGVVEVEGGVVTGLWEKSALPKGNTINAGVYLFPGEIFGIVEKVKPSVRGELELTDALLPLIKDRRLSARTLEYWLDVGYPWDLLDANEALLSCEKPEIEGQVEKGVSLNGQVTIGSGSVVLTGTRIEGPVAIGKDCRIGPHAYIRGATSIGDRCHVGHCSEIKNSVIMAETKVPHFNYIGDSVIGSGCNFGAGTKIANVRNDNKTIRVCGLETRRRKFGAIVGDDVRFGINCSVNVGATIGSGASFAPHSYVEGCIGDHAKFW
jgi:UDP-N-acetylglucosamine diphosphorylase/glucosamine-1-phosphate N-acetyltransferase